MNIHEYQAKELYRKYGIPVPKGIPCMSAEEATEAAKKLIEAEINPHVEQWERDHAFPAHEVFKKFGQAGFLGVNKPVEYGGQGLDYKYQARYTVL